MNVDGGPGYNIFYCPKCNFVHPEPISYGIYLDNIYDRSMEK